MTIISNNLSGGGSLACASLGRALAEHYDIQIIGSTYGSQLWPGLLNLDIKVDAFPAGPLPGYFRTMQRMVRRIRGDIVIAHQLRLPSFGTGLTNKLRHGTPCTLYLDDDDLALTMPGRANRWRNRLRVSNGDLSTRLMYRLRHRADAVFCGSGYFAHKFGGVTVPLGRDPAQYDPARKDREDVRQRLGIKPHHTVIGFMGNPRPHVGIEDLIAALEIVGDPHLLLLVVPPGQASDEAHRRFRQSSANIKVLNNQASGQIPSFLAASDIVVVPQRTEAHSLGQLPARLVEAMAMSKPIVTTRLPGIPELLNDGGRYVDERAPDQIAQAIRWLQANPGEAAAMGKKARDTFLRRLSLSAMAERLVPKLDSLITRSRQGRK